jgi:long-chain fatty acid transport protein
LDAQLLFLCGFLKFRSHLIVKEFKTFINITESKRYVMKKIFLTLLFMNALCIQKSIAGGFKIGLQGQKQLGMGHTGVGFAQDAATIYFNPAGMSFVGSQLNASFFALMPSTSFHESNTNTLTHAVNQVFTPFSFYGNVKLSKKMNFGLGIYTPFGSGVLYPNEWTGRYILRSIELQVIYFQPTISYRISDAVSIGGGFVYASGHVDLRKDIPIQGAAFAETAHAKLYGKGNGVGYNIGTYIKTDKINFGLTYHSKVNMKVDNGDAIFENIPTALASNFPKNNTFNAELPLPSELAFGTSFKISKRTRFAADINYTFWKSFDSLGFDYQMNTSTLSDAKSPRLYKNAFSIKGGLQYNASNAIQLRAGAFYDQTPVADGYVAPELPDNNKVGLTCGATFKILERFHIDCSILYESVAKRTQKNLETGLEGTFQTKAFAPGVGVTYLLQKRTYKRKRY